MRYEVIDTFGNHSMGTYEKREDAIYAIRLYCVQKMMTRVSLVNQDFVNLIDNGDEIIYDNPIGYFPNKPKFRINHI